MNTLRTIGDVAVYEAKALRRSRIFYIYCLLSIVVLVVGIAMLSEFSDAAPSPLLVQYMLSKNFIVIQTLFSVFLAAAAILREMKLNTGDSITVQSFTNATFITGKAVGVAIVIGAVEMVYFLLGAGYDLLFYHNTPFVPSGYPYYIILMMIPAFVLTVGLTMLCAALTKSRFAAMAFVLGTIAFFQVFIGDGHHYFFDVMCQTLPFGYSDFTGFGNLLLILTHRLAHLFQGIASIALTTLVFNRFSQSETARRVSIGIAVVFCIGAATLVAGYSGKKASEVRLRRDMINLQDNLSGHPQATVTSCDLDLIHEGDEIAVSAEVSVRNDTGVEMGIDMEAEFNDWQTQRELPVYDVYNPHYSEVVTGDKTAWQVKFLLHNNSDTDGVVSAHLSSNDGDGGIHVHLEGRQTKEVGILMNGEPVWGMRINPFVSRHCVYIDNFVDKRDAVDTDIFHGSRVVELSDKDKSGDIIVDNLDDGFEITSQPPDTIVMKMLSKIRKRQSSSRRVFNSRKSPGKWTYGFNNIFYGDPEPSAHYIKGGNGDYHVTFNADIHTAGRYDLHCYTPGRFPSISKKREPCSFHFIVHHDDGTDDKTLDITDTRSAWTNINNNNLKGWTKIGTYRFPRGKARVVLTDKTSGEYVCADALKWVKRTDE